MITPKLMLDRAGEEFLTHCSGESAPADGADGKGEETVVDVGAAFPAGVQAAELTQQREGLLDNPAHGLVVSQVPRRLVNGRIPR
ncbi:hypothetical protein ACWGRK_21590 [Saccharomonospora azurea]|uniref:hypothetical protein n=1 Tax=Saccharomonospora azurea TaxID=40988 RepID=UPI003D8AB64D